MKKFWVAVLCLVIVGFVLVSVGAAFGGAQSLYVNWWGFNFGDDEPIYDGLLDCGEFRNLSIEAASADIEILPGETYGVELKTSMRSRITWELTEQDELRIKQPNFSFIGIWLGYYGQDYIKVYVPQGEELSVVKVDTASGKVSLRGMSAEIVDVNMASGSMELSGISTRRLGIESVSGSVAMNDCTADDIQLNMTSGSLRGSGITANGLSVEIVSGRGMVSGKFTGKNTISLVSGSFEMDIEGNREDYGWEVSAVSGGMYVDGEKVIRSDRRREVKNDITADMVSGSVRIKFSGVREVKGNLELEESGEPIMPIVPTVPTEIDGLE